MKKKQRLHRSGSYKEYKVLFSYLMVHAFKRRGKTNAWLLHTLESKTFE